MAIKEFLPLQSSSGSMARNVEKIEAQTNDGFLIKTCIFIESCVWKQK